jgi:SAM-dependent methyltransferase
MTKLDIGCGPNKREGFEGVDRIAFPGVDHVVNVGTNRLPFEDSSVEEVHSSHFVEHLTAQERCQFVNELYRVMKPGAKATIITPHWASNRAYGDPTHQWPAVSEMWFYYLSKEWRKANAPHTDKEHWPHGFDCDFEATWGYSMHPALAVRNDQYKQDAMTWWKDAIQDTLATLTARKPV